jgi:ketosteroid isomerase-like protein
VSKENVDVVRRAMAAMNAGDWDAVFELYHPDIESRDLDHVLDVPEVTKGRAAQRAEAAYWTEVWDEFGAEVYKYIDAPPWVICDTRWHMKGKGSRDVPIEYRAAEAYEVKEGMIVRVVAGCRDMPTLRKLLGLEE